MSLKFHITLAVDGAPLSQGQPPDRAYVVPGTRGGAAAQDPGRSQVVTPPRARTYVSLANTTHNSHPVSSPRHAAAGAS